MDRRSVIKSGVVVAVAGASGLPLAWAEDKGPFKTLSRPLPRNQVGKVEVIEFFWYGCPHCYQFEPVLEAWVSQLPADITFHQIPVAWPGASKRVNYEGHQKIFFTLQAMGVLKQNHAKVFAAMHEKKARFQDDAEIFDFAKSIGLNREVFANTFKSFAVNAKCKQAAELIAAYQVEGVPTLGVDGRFQTTASLAGSEQNLLKVVDQLIQRARQTPAGA